MDNYVDKYFIFDIVSYKGNIIYNVVRRLVVEFGIGFGIE